jgi:ElaB/YqjD/DUF883 family membrane-anchored ribosome-binding protein
MNTPRSDSTMTAYDREVNSSPVTNLDDADTIEATRAEIEQTRAQMGQTIDEIKDRLSPATLMEEAKEAASDKVHDMVDAAKDKAKDVVAMASGAVHTATDYISDKATPVVETAKEKLAPVVDAAKSAGRSAKGAGETVVETVRMNPLPAALIGIGVGWLVMSTRQQHSSRYTNGYRNDYSNGNGNGWEGDRSYNAGLAYDSPERYAGAESRFEKQSPVERVKDSLHEAGDKMSSIASDAKHKASDLAVATKDKAQATVSSLDSWVHENPLAAGAVALLVGAAVGLAIPGTRRENELFGSKRDELAHKAAEKTHEVVDKVQSVAQVALGSAKDALGNAKEQVKEEVRTIKDEVMSEARTQGLASVS